MDYIGYEELNELAMAAKDDSYQAYLLSIAERRATPR